MHESIFEIAAYALSVTEEEQAILETLCSTAEAELTARLREGITPDDCGSVYMFSAALLAASEMLLLRSADGVEQFTAGEVNVRQSGEKTAAALRQQAAALMRTYCSDGDFAFLGVPG